RTATARCILTPIACSRPTDGRSPPIFAPCNSASTPRSTTCQPTSEASCDDAARHRARLLDRRRGRRDRRGDRLDHRPRIVPARLARRARLLDRLAARQPRSAADPRPHRRALGLGDPAAARRWPRDVAAGGVVVWALRRDDPQPLLYRIAPPGLILLALTVTFASIDATMSLDPDFKSSAYGLVVGTE